jgi:ribonuclease VapC
VIVVDTSVFVAILADEPEAARFTRALARADRRCISAGNYLECAMVADRRFQGRTDLDDWMAHRHVEVRPVDIELARLAAEGFARFGRGRHIAKLNYGDCFAYALAKLLNAPLLFKGDDFSHTDITPASA